RARAELRSHPRGDLRYGRARLRQSRRRELRRRLLRRRRAGRLSLESARALRGVCRGRSLALRQGRARGAALRFGDGRERGAALVLLPGSRRRPGLSERRYLERHAVDALQLRPLAVVAPADTVSCTEAPGF